MQYMPAVLVAKAKEVRDDGSIVEVVIWALSEPLKPSTHSYKYRLYYGAAGVCRVRYDNERGKGDHRHLGEREEDYNFISLEHLLADFERDVNEWSTP
ncbi:MAG: toxin-antitoxin system TumE family protein [Thiobacillus sp.]